MGPEYTRAEASPIRLARKDLEAVAADMSTSALDASRADAVVFLFDTSEEEERCIISHAPGYFTEVIDALRGFALSKADPKIAFEPAGMRMYRAKNGTQYFFILLPLMAKKRNFGAVAIAISRSNWTEQRAFNACSQVARLVSMNVLAAETRGRLERDLVALNLRTQQIKRQSEIDQLTGLENKASFETRARLRLAHNAAAALIIIDIDHFKNVNDAYGHQFGDIYLQTVARALRTCCPGGSFAGRIGGDEFAFLLDVPAESGAFLTEAIERVRKVVARNMDVLRKPELGKFCVGVSLFPQHAKTYEELFSYADSALYLSKETGRNATTIYSGDLRDESTEFMSMRAGFSGASGAFSQVFDTSAFSEISAGFQPIVNVTTGACTGVEALARSRRAQSRQSSPIGFTWMFRDHTVAPLLTRHIVTCGLSALNKLPAHIKPDLWINLTKFDLLDGNFVSNASAVLEQFDIGWDRIVVEVHEGIMPGEPGGPVYTCLQDIRVAGARVALDDFGSGYAGLGHMRDWPVDIIKVDQTFTGQIDRDPHARTVIKALQMITKSLGMDLVAEGIETASQFKALQSLSCKYGQGFFFDHAIAEDDLAARLAEYEDTTAAPKQSDDWSTRPAPIAF